jgi:DNA-binding beta-propeller fold protein YncE
LAPKADRPNVRAREETMPFRSSAAGAACAIAVSALFTQPAAAQAVNLPRFEVDATWPKVPPQLKIGDASSFAIDARDNVWLLHRPRTLKPQDADKAAPPVVVFDPAGNFVKAWGGAGTGYDWPEREHGIHIDHKGFVWIGGNNCPESGLTGLKPVADDAYLKFNQEGKFVLQIGKSNQSKGDADTVNVHRAADAWVHAPANELFVADGYGNHRVIIFDADTGAFKRTWGAFGKPPGGVDSCKIVSPTTFPDAEGPAHFNVAHAIRVANDGTVYLADRENRRVQMFTKDGAFVKQLIKTDTRFARNLALSPDPAQQFLYVGAEKGIAIVDRKALEIVGMIEVPGQLGPGHHIATDSKGNLYIAQTTAGMQKLVLKGGAPAATR